MQKLFVLVFTIICLSVPVLSQPTSELQCPTSPPSYVKYCEDWEWVNPSSTDPKWPCKSLANCPLDHVTLVGDAANCSMQTNAKKWFPTTLRGLSGMSLFAAKDDSYPAGQKGIVHEVLCITDGNTRRSCSDSVDAVPFVVPGTTGVNKYYLLTYFKFPQPSCIGQNLSQYVGRGTNVGFISRVTKEGATSGKLRNHAWFVPQAPNADIKAGNIYSINEDCFRLYGYLRSIALVEIERFAPDTPTCNATCVRTVAPNPPCTDLACHVYLSTSIQRYDNGWIDVCDGPGQTCPTGTGCVSFCNSAGSPCSITLEDVKALVNKSYEIRLYPVVCKGYIDNPEPYCTQSAGVCQPVAAGRAMEVQKVEIWENPPTGLGVAHLSQTGR